MRKIDIEFVVGFAMARWAMQNEIEFKANREFGEFVRKAVEDSLKYLDSPEEFRQDAMREIESMTEDVK